MNNFWHRFPKKDFEAIEKLLRGLLKTDFLLSLPEKKLIITTLDQLKIGFKEKKDLNSNWKELKLLIEFGCFQLRQSLTNLDSLDEYYVILSKLKAYIALKEGG